MRSPGRRCGTCSTPRSDPGDRRDRPVPESETPPIPRINRVAPRYRQLMAGFRVYVTTGIAAESLPKPRIYTCFRGVPVASDAPVVAADPSAAGFPLEEAAGADWVTPGASRTANLAVAFNEMPSASGAALAEAGFLPMMAAMRYEE